MTDLRNVEAEKKRGRPIDYNGMLPFKIIVLDGIVASPLSRIGMIFSVILTALLIIGDILLLGLFR